MLSNVALSIINILHCAEDSTVRWMCNATERERPTSVELQKLGIKSIRLSDEGR